MSFSWSIVEYVNDPLHKFIAFVFERISFRKVLSNQSVEIFVGSSLP